MTLRYLSICAGIEAASVAWETLGFQPALFAEIEAFPRAVLAHRQRAVDARRTGAVRQGVPLWGDFTTLRRRHLQRLGIHPPDILVGGTPCQAFSTAGRRRSLEDARGNLTLAYVRLAHAIDPRWVIWENVPGILATHDNAFGCFLAGLVGSRAALLPPNKRRWPDAGMVAGPRRTAAWRTLDAQYFGLAQRRRRVFVVSGRSRERTNPGAILFEPECLRRRASPRHAAGAEIAGTFEARAHDPGVHGAATGRPQLAYRISGDGSVCEEGDRTAPLRTGTDKMATLIAFGVAIRGRDGGASVECGDDLANALRASQGGGDKPFALIASQAAHRVRRLLPVECERLQGFPDGYTDIPWRGQPAGNCPDGPRYKALGNSMAVPVMRWIGERIAKFPLPTGEKS